MGKTQTAERKRIQEPEAVVETIITCQHHWLIDSPRGSMSSGRCKRCGEKREFRNSATDHIWEDDSSSDYSPWRGVRSTPKPASDDEVAAAPRSASGEPALAV
jgi:hypothetical protein